MSNDSHAVNGVSFLNQACTRLFLKMVSKNTRVISICLIEGERVATGFRWWLSQINCRHILPATSNNRVSKRKVRAWMPADRTQDVCAPRCAPNQQKENQCQES